MISVNPRWRLLLNKLKAQIFQPPRERSERIRVNPR